MSFINRNPRWNLATVAQPRRGRRVRTAGIAAVLLVAGAATSAGAAPDRPTRPRTPADGVLLSETASRPEGAASGKLEEDYPHVDYVHLSPADLVHDLVTSMEPTSVDDEHSCQPLEPRDNTVEVSGQAIAFTGVEASLCDPGEGSYLAWHGQRRTADDDLLASISLAVSLDEDGAATAATGTIQDEAAGYELMPVEGGTYALYELAPSNPEGESNAPVAPEEPAEEGAPETTTSTTIIPPVVTTTLPPNGGGATTSTTVTAGDQGPSGGDIQPQETAPEGRESLVGDGAEDAEPGDIDGGQPRPGGPSGNRTVQVRFAYAAGMTDTQAYLYMLNRTEQTNDSFINSNMPVRIEGLGPVAANYTQSSAISDDLTRLGNPSDSYMDTLLSDFGATTIDALALLVPNSTASACGQGRLSTEVSANTTFLTVSAMQSGCNYTLTHELGHNLSAHHNPEDAGGNTAFPWSYGHYSLGKKRDVMSYDACSGSCPRVLQWSDPDDGFLGYATTPSGTSYRDNDRSVTDTSWAASQQGNTSSNDSIWYRSASSHSSFSVPDDIEAPYTPVSGDFDGDGNSDQFWYFPGRPLERLWEFNSTNGSYDEHSLDVVGNYRPVVGDFDGDGRDDLFWHAPGSDGDSIWWGTPDPVDLGTVVTTLSISGSYYPQSGDIDGDGRDDVVWYAPGTANDYIWWGNATRSTFAGGSGSTGITVNGTYHLTLGDHNADGRDDLSWFQPGTGSDFLWHGMASHSAVGSSNQTNYTQDGQRTPKTGDFNGDGKDDIFWYGPGSEPDSIWWGQSTMASFVSAPGWSGQTVGGTYSPTTGDFNGDGFVDLFWFSFG